MAALHVRWDRNMCMHCHPKDPNPKHLRHSHYEDSYESVFGRKQRVVQRMKNELVPVDILARMKADKQTNR